MTEEEAKTIKEQFTRVFGTMLDQEINKGVLSPIVGTGLLNLSTRVLVETMNRYISLPDEEDI